MNEKKAKSAGKTVKKSDADKSTPTDKTPVKKVFAEKPPAKKSQAKGSAPKTQKKMIIASAETLSFIKKLEGIGKEVENISLKAFAKEERDKIVKTYENLISKIIREINHCRR